MDILIYTDTNLNELAICRDGDMTMRAQTADNVMYTTLYDVIDTDTETLDDISEDIIDALDLHVDCIEASDHIDGMICDNCGAYIEGGCVESVLMSGDKEICTLTTTCTECI